MVASTSVFGTNFNQKKMEGVKEKGKGVSSNFSQEIGKGVQEMVSKKDPSGSSVATCREYLEGGGWTMVAKRKPRPPLKNQLGKARGIPSPMRRQFGGGAVGQGKEGGGGHGQPGRKPLLVYTKRGGKTPPLILSSSMLNASLDSKVPPSIPKGSGGAVQRVIILKRPKGRNKEVGGVIGGDIDVVEGGELGDVAARALVVYTHFSPSSLVDEVMKKRRRGGDGRLCGGDAFPLERE